MLSFSNYILLNIQKRWYYFVKNKEFSRRNLEHCLPFKSERYADGVESFAWVIWFVFCLFTVWHFLELLLGQKFVPTKIWLFFVYFNFDVTFFLDKNTLGFVMLSKISNLNIIIFIVAFLILKIYFMTYLFPFHNGSWSCTDDVYMISSAKYLYGNNTLDDFVLK